MSGEVPSKKYEKSVKLIILLLLSLLMFAVTACSGKGRSDADTQLLSSVGDAVDSSESITKIDSLELSYATQFSVDYYSECHSICCELHSLLIFFFNSVIYII